MHSHMTKIKPEMGLKKDLVRFGKRMAITFQGIDARLSVRRNDRNLVLEFLCRENFFFLISYPSAYLLLALIFDGLPADLLSTRRLVALVAVVVSQSADRRATRAHGFCRLCRLWRLHNQVRHLIGL